MFYTFLVISTALLDKPPFKNLIMNCHVFVLVNDGQKMSARTKNCPDKSGIINKYGADYVSQYLVREHVYFGLKFIT